MKRLLLTLALVLIGYAADAQTIDLGKFTIDKNACTITRKSDGKTFNLYGNIEIVESFPDICVKIVDSFEDLDVKIVKDTPSRCCEFRKVDSFRDIRVKIVTSFPDITVKLVDSFPGINR
ncbi:MAG: hypothetical protein J6U21_15105 [Bacteroidales bacterium]|nr:hypothetical protein [Bacteroidales bacterium]